MSMADLSYKQVLELLRKQIEELRGSIPISPEIALRLDNLEKGQQEIIHMLRELNGNVRSNTTAVAVYGQWQKGHVDQHTVLGEQVKRLDIKSNFADGITAAIGVGAAILSFLRGGQ